MVSVRTARQVKAIAEPRTGGIAVSARRTPLKSATGGREVEVHLLGEAQGWPCIVDRDSHGVRSRTRIPNPRPPKSRR